MSGIIAGITTAGMIALGVLFVMWILKDWVIVIGRPNDALFFEGGEERGGATKKLHKGGRKWRNILYERVRHLDLSLMLIEINIENTLTKNGVPLTARAIANVKITGERKNVENAAERFLGQSRDELRRVAQETLQGALREIFAQMTPEEANQDRLKFTKQLMKSTDDDFDKLGLELDALKIQNLETPDGYLDDIGRKRIADVKKQAEVAKAKAQRAAKEAEADAKQRGEVANQKAKAKIQKAENELGEFKAELEKKVESEWETAKARGEEARNKAQKELQTIRKKLEELKLQSDVVIPAQAKQKAEELRAEGEAAEMAEQGKAMGEVMDLMAELWREGGDDAMDVFIIQRLESVLDQIAEKTNEVKVDEAALIDGGDGESLPNYVSAYPKIMGNIFEELQSTMGVDVSGALTGQKSNGKTEPVQQSDSSGQEKSTETKPSPAPGSAE